MAENEVVMVPETQVGEGDELRNILETIFKETGDVETVYPILKSHAVHGEEEFLCLPIDDNQLQSKFDLKIAMHRLKILKYLSPEQ
jgi:hypothetical protein